MPLDHLLAALDRDTALAAERLLANARSEADALTAAAEEAHRRQREATLEPGRRAAHAAMEQAVAERRRQANGDALRARDRLIDRVFVAIRAALGPAVDRQDLRDSMTASLQVAFSCASPDVPVTIDCAEALAPALGPVAERRGSARLRMDAAVGAGFRLRPDDDRLEVSDTLEARLERSSATIAREALRQLGIRS